MEVKLSWITPDAEEVVLHHARVSSKDPDSKDTRLLNYLIKNAHWSPFEMANVCFSITCSRAMARQLLRHRSFSFQEFSQRYAEVADNPLITEGRRQGKTARQQSTEPLSELDQQWWQDTQKIIWGTIIEVYKKALARGISRECARVLLPEGMAPTLLHVNGTLRSWIHYCDLRNDPASGTQAEHMAIAAEVVRLLKEHCPVTAQALEKNEGFPGWK